MWQALYKAKTLGHRAILLVGDAAYYSRFGFSAEKTGALRMPGPYARERLLACELVPDALTGARGVISAANPPPSQLSRLVKQMSPARHIHYDTTEPATSCRAAGARMPISDAVLLQAAASLRSVRRLREIQFQRGSLHVSRLLEAQ